MAKQPQSRQERNQAPGRAHGQINDEDRRTAGELPLAFGASSSGSIVVRIEPNALALLTALLAGGLLIWLWSTGALHLPEVPEVDASTSLWLIFITGLTAGGLSCLAVQGGLLATTVAQREQRFIEANVENRVRVSDHAAPILLFLAAKLVAYTLLGALLGIVGSFIALSPPMRGVFQILVGLFMLGVAFQMLNVHPIFRRFAFEPPKRVQRMVRKQSKRDDAFTPLLLGALTVLIPCGVTMAMMAVATASGSALRGALVMFAFVLGTTPAFFILGLLATRLSAVMHKAFLNLAAVTVAALALLSIVTGYRLLPISGRTTATAITAPSSSAFGAPGGAGMTTGGAKPPDAEVGQSATINVLAHGYSPEVVRIRAGQPARINLVTNNIFACTRAFTIPALNIERILPATGSETIEIPASAPGQIAYTCGMGMYSGVIEVVQ